MFLPSKVITSSQVMEGREFKSHLELGLFSEILLFLYLIVLKFSMSQIEREFSQRKIKLGIKY